MLEFLLHQRKGFVFRPQTTYTSTYLIIKSRNPSKTTSSSLKRHREKEKHPIEIMQIRNKGNIYNAMKSQDISEKEKINMQKQQPDRRHCLKQTGHKDNGKIQALLNKSSPFETPTVSFINLS